MKEKIILGGMAFQNLMKNSGTLISIIPYSKACALRINKVSKT